MTAQLGLDALAGLPDWTLRAVLVALVAGFPVAMLLSWAFRISSLTCWTRSSREDFSFPAGGDPLSLFPAIFRLAIKVKSQMARMRMGMKFSMNRPPYSFFCGPPPFSGASPWPPPAPIASVRSVPPGRNMSSSNSAMAVTRWCVSDSVSRASDVLTLPLSW